MTKTLGETLKESRVLLGMTLKQVEDASNISNAYLSQLENNKIKKPSASVLYKLSTLYNVSLNTFLKAAGIIEKVPKTSKSSKANDAELEEWGKRVAFYTGELSDEQRTKILEYIRFIKSNK